MKITKEMIEQAIFENKNLDIHNKISEIYECIYNIVDKKCTYQTIEMLNPFKFEFKRNCNVATAMVRKNSNEFTIFIGDEFLSRLFIFAEMNVKDIVKAIIDDDNYNSDGINTDLDKLDKDSLISMLYSIWIFIILYHEFFHIVRGHLDYISDIEKLNVLDYVELELEDFSESKSKYNSVENNIILEMENEADQYAIKYAFLHFMGYKEEGFETPKYIDKVRRLWSEEIKNGNNYFDLAFFSIACAMLYMFMDCIKSKSDTKHPPPYFRLARSLSTGIHQSDSNQLKVTFTLLNQSRSVLNILGVDLLAEFEKDYINVFNSISKSPEILKEVMKYIRD